MTVDPRIPEAVGALGVPDRAIDFDSLPWVPQGDRVWFRPLRFDLANGRWVNVLRVSGGGRVNRHRHSGGQVLGYCLEGAWRYLERDWEARPGTFIYEPPGDIHTLVTGGSGMTTLFLLEGVIQYLDDSDTVVAQDDVFTKLQRYLDYCRAEGLQPQDLCY